MREGFVRFGRLLALSMVVAIIGGCMSAMNGDSMEGEVDTRRSRYLPSRGVCFNILL